MRTVDAHEDSEVVVAERVSDRTEVVELITPVEIANVQRSVTQSRVVRRHHVTQTDADVIHVTGYVRRRYLPTDVTYTRD